MSLSRGTVEWKRPPWHPFAGRVVGTRIAQAFRGHHSISSLGAYLADQELKEQR